MAQSTIKPKKGKCIDCPEGSPEKYLTAGRCKDHYWTYRTKVNSSKPHNVARKEEKKQLGVYFASQILQMPEHCENCKNRIYTRGLSKRAAICHIVKKEFFKSVEIHPQNKWFGCIDCHTKYDTGGEEVQRNMPVAAIVIERFKIFMHEIAFSEKRRLPLWLKEILNGQGPESKD